MTWSAWSVVCDCLTEFFQRWETVGFVFEVKDADEWLGSGWLAGRSVEGAG